jgi:hypothetical protein
MTTGILLIAVGHGNYGKMAAQLACSIRANGIDLPILLAHDENTIKYIPSEYKAFFTDFLLIPEHCTKLGENSCYIKVKSHMYELSPFDATLFLDVDCIALNNGRLAEVLNELKNVDFAIKNSGGVKFSDVKDGQKQWADIKQVQVEYNLHDDDMIWNVHSEFIWWKKTPENEALFTLWNDTFETLKVEPVEFGGCIPDELPLWIAMSITGRKPHEPMYHPSFWPMDSAKKLRIRDLSDYALVSIGGAVINDVQKNNYDLLATIHCKRMNVRHIFKCENKKRWEPTRHTI